MLLLRQYRSMLYSIPDLTHILHVKQKQGGFILHYITNILYILAVDPWNPHPLNHPIKSAAFG